MSEEDDSCRRTVEGSAFGLWNSIKKVAILKQYLV